MQLDEIKAKEIIIWLANKVGYDSVKLELKTDYNNGKTCYNLKFFNSFDKKDNSYLKTFDWNDTSINDHIHFLEFHGSYTTYLDCLNLISKLSNKGYEIYAETSYHNHTLITNANNADAYFPTLIKPHTSLESLLIEYDLDVSRK